MRHRVTAAATLVLAVLYVFPLIARATGGKSPRSTPLAALAPVATIFAVAATAVAASFTWWLGVILAVPAVFMVAWQLPPRRPAAEAPGPETAPANASPETVVLRFLTLNAYVGRVSPAAVVAGIRRLSPDVFAIQELTPGLAEDLAEAGVAELLPFSCLEPRPGARGIGLWSRFPLAEIPLAQGTRKAMLRAQLDLGWPVTVTVVHLASPVGGRQPAWQQDMDRLLLELTEVTGQHLVAGDFNASRDHGAFRRLLAAQFADSADAAARRQWPGFTWPAHRPVPPLMRLDHILVSHPGTAVQEARTVEIAGSDHRAVFAVIELTPVRSDGQAQSHGASAATTTVATTTGADAAGRSGRGGPDAATSDSGSPGQEATDARRR